MVAIMKGRKAAAPLDQDAARLHDLIRAISQAASPTADPPLVPARGYRSEQILLDADVDGDRYVLIRIPARMRKPVSLSPREWEIVRMVAQGHPNKRIALLLDLSSWTVGTHVRRIFAKLGVGSRA